MKPDTRWAPLTREGIRKGLGEIGSDVDIHLYQSIDSTNTHARRLLSQTQSGSSPDIEEAHDTISRPLTLLAARAQTAGRGRMGRSFYSPADSGLYMTLLFPADRPLSEAVTVTAAAAVATVRAIRDVTGLCPGIKWVNDLYLGGKKVCGILTEAVTPSPQDAALLPPPCRAVPFLLVGIGINLTTDTFPDGLRDTAGCLSDFLPAADGTSIRPDAGILCGSVARRLLSLVPSDSLRARDCLEAYRALSLLPGHRILCTRGNETFEGQALGITDRYGLSVRRDDGSLTVLDSGEARARPADPS